MKTAFALGWSQKADGPVPADVQHGTVYPTISENMPSSGSLSMTLIYPNIVPENNLRLPDALTIKHGPAPLLSRFVLEGDRAARSMGIRLRLRHDFPELLYFNKERIARGDWYRLANMFHPEYSNLSPENSYWISGENEHGDIVVTQAGRIYY